MFALAESLGCPAVNNISCPIGVNGRVCQTSVRTCLCRQLDFTYGIRDCSSDVCGDADVVSLALAERDAFCTRKGGSRSRTGVNHLLMLSTDRNNGWWRYIELGTTDSCYRHWHSYCERINDHDTSDPCLQTDSSRRMGLLAIICSRICYIVVSRD